MGRQADIDERNNAFWDELCGTAFAQQVGITGRGREDLRRYDEAFFAYYPYLARRVPIRDFAGKKVLEVGLGYGSVGQAIANAGALYTGLDIANGPVDMMNFRLEGNSLGCSAIQGSILQAPFENEEFDAVVSIGCLHHTGDMQRGIDEIRRILKPGGTAYVMVYNALGYANFRRWPLASLAAFLGRPGRLIQQRQWEYDHNASGDSAPETVFTIRRDLRQMFRDYSRYEDHLENWIAQFRDQMLPTVARIAGSDIYAAATK